MKTVAVSEKSFNADAMAFSYGPLANALGAIGYKAVVLNGKEDLIEGSEFGKFHTFTRDGALVEVTEKIAVEAARDLTGGLARYSSVPSLNPQGLRDTVMSKKGQYDALSPVLGEMLPQSFFAQADPDSVLEAMQKIETPTIVLKPEKGRFSNKILIGSKDDIEQQLSDYTSAYTSSDGLVVVQSYIEDVNSGFAPSIKGLTPTDKELMLRQGVKEIRVHVIDGKPFLVHGKVSAQGASTQAGNSYVFFDQESIPSDVIVNASKAAELLHKGTKSQDSYLAVDITPSGSTIVEVNGRKQGSITSDLCASPEPHNAWVTALSEKLAAMAERSDGERVGN